MDYVDFLSRLDPAMLGLESSSATLDRAAFWTSVDDAERAVSSKYILSKVGEDYFDVQASFSLSIQKAEQDGPVKRVLAIDCTFWGHFHVDAPIPAELAKRFAETESWLLFWPFFRQFVADSVARMSIPPVIIPLALGPGDYRRPLKPRTSGSTARRKARATTSPQKPEKRKR